MKDIQPGEVPSTTAQPIHVTTFNLKNASPTFGAKDQDLHKMYHNTAPPMMGGDCHYQDVGGISNFADYGDRKDNLANKKISSFQNAFAATQQ